MPICMCASTHPGNARRFLASKTVFALSAAMSGSSRAILPSLTAMSRQSIAVLFGRTTRAFLITTSKVFSMPDIPWIATNDVCCQVPSHFADFVDLGHRCRRFILFAALKYLRRADQAIESVEIKHPRPERFGRAVRLQRSVKVLRGLRQRPHDGAWKDHHGKTERL